MSYNAYMYYSHLNKLVNINMYFTAYIIYILYIYIYTYSEIMSKFAIMNDSDCRLSQGLTHQPRLNSSTAVFLGVSACVGDSCGQSSGVPSRMETRLV